MRDIAVEIDVGRMNVLLIKLICLYESIGALFERESLVENYVFLSLVKAGVPMSLNKQGEFRVMFGTLDIGTNTFGGASNPLYVWKDVEGGEGEAA